VLARPWQEWLLALLRRWFANLVPDLRLASINGLKSEILAEQDIDVVILDYSGTLAASLNHYPEPEIVAQFKKLEPHVKMVIVSDVWFDFRLDWQARNIIKLADELGIPCQIASLPYCKMTGLPIQQALRKVIGRDYTKPIAIVGDGRIRDIWIGNRLGFYTIHITELMPGCYLAKRLRKLLGRIIKKLLFGFPD